MHADGRTRGVPPLREQLRVDQDVDLAALVGGERLGQLARRRPAGDGHRLEARCPELLGEVVGVVDTGRVDDSRCRAEAVAVEARRGLVERDVVEGCGQRALLEVAADDRHRVDRGDRRHAQGAERRDEAAARGVGERQVVDRGREDVGDLLRDQLLRRRHADVERLREAPDRGRGLLAERGVRLVADHELVRAARELVAVPGEPGVCLDRDRVGPERLLAALDRVREALAVAFGRQIAAELVDEKAAMGEDQHPEMAGRLDEPRRCDGLPGRGRVAEAIAAGRPRILAGDGRLFELLLDELGILLVLELAFLDELRDAAVGRAVAVLLGASLGRGDQLGEHPGERVDLMPAEGGAGGGRRTLGREHPLEAEHQAVADLPAGRRRAVARVDLLDRVAEREAPCRARRERDLRVLARVQERLAEPALGAMRGAFEVRERPGRRVLSGCGFLHVRSSLETRRPAQRNRSRKAAHSGVVPAPASLHPAD